MRPIHPEKFSHIVFFTGAGMSAESGVPTYRGSGGIWHEYRWEEYACQAAFDKNPEKVLAFHELRRKSVLSCTPHQGHFVITELQARHPRVTLVTQNIDGMHQRAGSKNVIELHGSLWRLRCPVHGISEDIGPQYKHYACPHCGNWLRPDITWFQDSMNLEVMEAAEKAISSCDLFISIGTSGVVWPAAGFPEVAKKNGAYCIEINPEPSSLSHLFDQTIRASAGKALQELFPKE